MLNHYGKSSLAILVAVAVSAWALEAPAQSGHRGNQHGTQGAAMQGDRHAGGEATPHGGQMTMTGTLGFEVVYRPKQTRVYLYGADHRPLSTRGVQGELAMQVPGNDQVFRFPLQYTAARPGSTDQDYLAAAVDVSRIRDGGMTVGLELANLPDPRQSRATFSQTFALSKLPVKVALLDRSDSAGIARQKTCPVSGGALGSMGTPIKVLVGDQPLYLCCKGCLGKFQKNPQYYLDKMAPAAAAGAGGQIRVATATTADQAAIEAQGKCPVSGNALGRMGVPVKLTVGGQSLFVCCKGCVAKVQAKPDYYLAKAAELRAAR